MPNYIALVTPRLRNRNSVFPGFKSGQQVKRGLEEKEFPTGSIQNGTYDRKWKDVGKLPNTQTHKCFNRNVN